MRVPTSHDRASRSSPPPDVMPVMARCNPPPPTPQVIAPLPPVPASCRVPGGLPIIVFTLWSPIRAGDEGSWVCILRRCHPHINYFQRPERSTFCFYGVFFFFVHGVGGSDYHEGYKSTPGNAHNFQESVVKCVSVRFMVKRKV